LIWNNAAPPSAVRATAWRPAPLATARMSTVD
jgi:hypothetical protein